MSGSIRSRQKRKLEPISIEELAGTTGMSGFCTFLTRDSSIRVPALDALESSADAPAAPESGAAVSPALETIAPSISAPESTAPQIAACGLSAPVLLVPTPNQPLTAILTAPETSAADLSAPYPRALESDAPDLSAPESTAVESFPRRHIRIREASTVQDGHSLAEQAVYDAMYRSARPYQGDSRILTIGLRTLAELSRMAYSNCKANVRSLVAKLAIDEQPGFSYTEGRTYIVYSFREILRRRKAAGLTHVIRNRGVAFVDPRTGTQLSAPDSSASQLRALPATASISRQSAPEPDKTGAPADQESSAPVPGPHIENRHLLRNTGETSSSFPPSIISALRRYIPDVDDEAAAQLWHRCRANAPDARVDEVAYFIDLKAGKPGIRMPLGFLLTAVPKCFSGDSFRQFREERERTRQSAADRDRQFAAEILRSPEADEEQKQWAREVLGL
jgi:hypothetical protein